MTFVTYKIIFSRGGNHVLTRLLKRPKFNNSNVRGKQNKISKLQYS